MSDFANITVRNLQVDRITGNGAAYSIVGLAVDPDGGKLVLTGSQAYFSS